MLIERFKGGDPRALARIITLLESGEDFPEELRQLPRTARVIGITGSPGSGKSTLTDQIIQELRNLDLRVAVIAVDPSSPFTGGAILGDRIRMSRHALDSGVFIRSLASRGALGGVSSKTLQVLSALEAFGFDVILIETVGVGQSEVDIASIADHTVLVLTPNQGDAVQAFKAGVMEIADIFVVNKCDLPGADRVVRELHATVTLGITPDWMPPAVKTNAQKGEGIAELLQALQDHRDHLGEEGLRERRLHRLRFELRSLLEDWAQGRLKDAENQLPEVLSGKRSLHELFLSLF
ncbi:methylmalonyl Co-A mutase-associated GTPase MeaB [Deinococcus cellulosilyticus]|uniref:LAO/AO transport system kinase n=1 Tax=Deinococcus cellulosilyticus (strain DSM 18568 / NBRC 106333 / KACC 11606 / 5516J-15) TaxID=1223518 RepID=A0A511N6M8_DEIC1|nr:methylmalonyl Co-A mutase-associated GTPase MeaB [Deinococcus cellulosilyticus]GEM48061.1 LAO/AO transport system kinase [Deinococcus cellulosilyticus NBRC 106333 = KACC 11606]